LGSPRTYEVESEKGELVPAERGLYARYVKLTVMFRNSLFPVWDFGGGGEGGGGRERKRERERERERRDETERRKTLRENER